LLLPLALGHRHGVRTACFMGHKHATFNMALWNRDFAGICYPALEFITVIMGFRHVFVRVPWQRAYLAIFAAFSGTVGESFIIDTDHWRHFWMMLGAMWGMFAAAQRYKASTSDQAPIASGDPRTG